MFPFDTMNVQLLANLDSPTFNPDPLIDHIFSPDPAKVALPKIIRSLLSGNVEAVNETLEGGITAIEADTTLSDRDKQGLADNLNALQNEVCKRVEGKKFVLVPESIATRTLYFHPELGLELIVSHQARQALLNLELDDSFLAEPIMKANKQALKQVFFQTPTVWEGVTKPFLVAILEHLTKNGPRPSYVERLKKPEFKTGATLYAKRMQEILQKEKLQLGLDGHHLLIQPFSPV